MRMFLLFALLFIPVISLANVDPEICFNIGNNETLCNSTAGCLYYPETNSNKCKQCSEDYYCLATETQPRECPSPFTKSDLGATSPEECYQTINCQDHTDTPQECRYYNTENTPYRCGHDFQTPAHIESETCYYDIRLCNKFGTPVGCDGGDIINAAYWNNNQWNIEGCKCAQGNTLYQSCIASIEKKSTTTTQPSAQSSITYNNVSYYFCTGCPAGSYVNPDTDFQTNSKCFASDSSVLVVCQCTNVERGYYGAGVNNIEYPISNTSAYSQSPYRNACPAGKTTNGPSATSENDCEYSSETQFCDSKGCFQFGNDFENWDLHI